MPAPRLRRLGLVLLLVLVWLALPAQAADREANGGGPSPEPAAAKPLPAADADADSKLAQLARPGVARPTEPPNPSEQQPVVIDPAAVPPPPRSSSYEITPVPDRWRLIEAIGVHDNPLNPYQQSTIKGDRPVVGDWFVIFSAISDTVAEPRSVPVPIGLQTTNRPGSNSQFGKPRQFFANENLILSLSVLKGDTAFKPPDLELRFTPVVNRSYVGVEERRLLFADPRRGISRNDGFIGVQELSLDYHLRNVSDRYDFDAARLGIQPFSSDFRGFLFQDEQLGMRLFGNRGNNRYQYNLAFFRRIEKDTNSGLNDLGQDLRKDSVLIGNVYAQDLPIPGFTSQATIAYNRNRESEFSYDKNGFLVRPSSLGLERPHDYDVVYLGLNGDGHFGRVNLTNSFYYALGQDQHHPFTDAKADIRAFFLAAEPSIDFNWIRLRGSALYASGDSKPFDNKETGFDAILENPQFAGADTSYWIRQGIPLIGGGGVALSGRNGVLPSLRSSKDEGQSNFVNPGLILLGAGADFDVLPELRLSVNANHLQFATTEVLQVLRQQDKISRTIGWDLSAAATYRPFQTQNVILRLSGAVLFPGQGLKDLYDNASGDKYYYSVLANLILTY
ncbi:MAG: hypothetical protein HYR63_22990 [Proteobacteria bacterium]|nr:hypothetical protein [Pseudomonadota bacterium]